MNKPAMATLGLIGACAACCTIPIAVPLMSGMLITALAWLTSHEITVVIAGLVLAAFVAAALRRRSRLQRKSVCAAEPSGTATTSRCGCSEAPRKQSA